MCVCYSVNGVLECEWYVLECEWCVLECESMIADKGVVCFPDMCVMTFFCVVSFMTLL